MKISHIFRFEVLRDGGSLIVSFQGDDSCEYWVMFPIKEYDPENLTYKAPVLVNRTTNIEVDLSYDGAKQWLKTIEPYFFERDELPYVSKKEEEKLLIKMLGLCTSGST